MNDDARDPRWVPITGRFPWRDLRGYGGADLRADVLAALAVAVLTVPQAMAYAMIAGLPPMVGLYAASVPTVVGSLFRSSRHVITGPSNALSLLAGSVIAAHAAIAPVTAASALALGAGLFQTAFGVLGVGALVDYISRPVVRGYITGVAVLILLGQLPEVAGLQAEGAGVVATTVALAARIGQAHPPTLALALGTMVGVWLLRRLAPRLPAPLLLLIAGALVCFALDLREAGVRTVADVAHVSRGLPPPALPAPGPLLALWPGALACAMLSLIESTAVARTIASRSGQQLDHSVEFVGQGLANVAAGICGAYPTSGSIGRSAFNERAGARSRLSGALSGALMLGVLYLFTPLLGLVPLPSLAGLIVVVAIDLLELPALGAALRASPGDAAALLVTLVGTWTFRLDIAIGIGVAVTFVMFLRNARLLVVSDLVVGEDGTVRESSLPGPGLDGEAIRVVHVEGSLFFGAAGELQSALEERLANPGTQVLVVRLKRTQGIDFTTATLLGDIAVRARARGQHLLLTGLRADAMRLLARTGAAERLGSENLFPSQPGWFVAVRQAIEHAVRLCPEARTRWHDWLE